MTRPLMTQNDRSGDDDSGNDDDGKRDSSNNEYRSNGSSHSDTDRENKAANKRSIKRHRHDTGNISKKGSDNKKNRSSR